ncbi:hypothetical protein BGZ95_007414 [Linnemannia exigua]|uniref:HCP-like protein n=1 Tax=Linnemannia exigua TaxID=604196 RepID=A0AAD4DFA9_9FUNG|nr:hypothetical protein BGZ95_007414 [Linnemannia exigua]
MHREENDTQERLQAIRPLHNSKNNNAPQSSTSAGTTDWDVVHLAIYLDPAGRAIVFWEDVLVAFKNALHIRQGSCILPFLRGSDYKLLYPLRIAAIPNRVLDVYIEEPSTRSSPNTQTTTRMMHLVEEVMEDIVRRVSEYALSESGVIPKSHDSNNSNNSNYDITAAVSAENSENYNVSAESRPSGNTPPPQEQQKASQHNTSSIYDSTSKALLSKLSTSAATNDKSYLNNNHQQENLIKLCGELLRTILRQGDTNSGVVSDKPTRVATDSDTGPYTGTNTDDSVSRHFVDSGKSKDESPGTAHAQQALIDDDINDIPKGLRDVAAKAMQGDIESQYSLAQSYNYGSNELSRNDRLAMVWYGKAANQGHAESQCCMGGYYKEGFTVPKDYAKAMEWFLKSARQGHHGAQYRIGLMYEFGDGVPEDKNKAMEWHLRAANGGNVMARVFVGNLREQGYNAPTQE